MTVKVRVVSPWFNTLELEDAFFSAGLPAEEADALLCDWAPAPELLAFPRRKAWYCCEPENHFRELGGQTWPHIRNKLAGGEFLWHNHPDPRFRVPHMTHDGALSMNRTTDRRHHAVAIVSNHGGSPWRRHADTSKRNRFVTHALVDLYGRSGWSTYRRGRFARTGMPANYRGEIAGDWPAAEKRAILARYKVAVCLENRNEPNYFTEKFVEAVCAGCIPVYTPDEHTASGALLGAFWVDPLDYENDPEATITAALAEDLDEVQGKNAAWLETNTHLHATSLRETYRRIAGILIQDL